LGLKATYGRTPRGPHLEYGNITSVAGCVSRSVRDTARWFDAANGHEPSDPLSLQRVDGWERDLGTHLGALRGRRAAVAADWGNATVSPAMWERLDAAAADLISQVGLRRVDGIDTALPRMGAAWAISGSIGVHGELGDRWPGCEDDLTPEVRAGLRLTADSYNLESRVRIERRRRELNDTMAELFSQVDFVITASNPDVAFEADGPLPHVFGGVEAGAANNGRLTFPANLHGNPAISIPGGELDGLPIGLQIVARHFEEPLLLELALAVERERPWPLVAPAAPC
jgi:aspartyl-tRNA(Asn)/glutamyl-tRNA(Gln) amidotransferase subunit A